MHSLMIETVTWVSSGIHSVVRAVTPSPAPSGGAPNTQGLADWLRAFFGPLFLVVVGIVALFFLFTREVTRFIQFIVLALAIAVIFYYPGLVPAIAGGIAKALGLQ